MAEEQFFIAVEKHVLLESRCINTALLDMSVYFTFDIAYSKPLHLCIQVNCILDVHVVV